MNSTSLFEPVWRRKWHAVLFLLLLAGCAPGGGCSNGQVAVEPNGPTTTPDQTDASLTDPERTIAKNIEIEIDDIQVRWGAHLSRGREDRIRWYNSGAEDITIHFTDPYPFAEDEEDIAVPAGKHSKWYKVREDVRGTSIRRYETTPSRSGWAPEGPQVSVGD